MLWYERSLHYSEGPDFLHLFGRRGFHIPSVCHGLPTPSVDGVIGLHGDGHGFLMNPGDGCRSRHKQAGSAAEPRVRHLECA